MIHPRPWSRCRQNPKRHGDQNGQQECRQRQFRRRREQGCQIQRHRATRRQRLTQVAPQQILPIHHESLENRFVQTHCDPDLPDRLFVCFRPGEMYRRIAGQRSGQHKADHNDPDDHGEGLQNPQERRAQAAAGQHGLRGLERTHIQLAVEPELVALGPVCRDIQR